MIETTESVQNQASRVRQHPVVRMVARIVRALDRRVRAAIAVAAARSTTRRRFHGVPIRRIVVVCYGNIYRSPFVGERLRRHFGAEIEIRTAGFHCVAGRPSPDRHVEMCRRHSVSLAEHRSGLITPADLAWADTIVFMDRHNWSALDAMGVDHSKLVWLGALSKGRVEIADPYGMDESAAQQVLTRLDSATQALIDGIRMQQRTSQ